MDSETDQHSLLGADASGDQVRQSEAARPTLEDSGAKEMKRQGEKGSGEQNLKDTAAPLRYAAPLGGRKGAMLRSLPVIFVLALVSVVVAIYVTYHIAPLLQQHSADSEAFSRGLGELLAFSILLTLFVTCFLLSIFAHPGKPDEGEECAVEQAAVCSYH